MRLLLDTHVLLWRIDDQHRMDETVHALIDAPENAVFVSAASIWEIAIKRRLGKLQAPGNLTAVIASSGLDVVSITADHAEAAGALPPHHADPFDRMLVAQARLEGLTLVTRDRRLERYGVAIIPA